MKTAAVALRVAVTGIALSLALGAHPMGNFSVNHYSHLSVHGDRASLAYVLDLAEIPTFQLLSQWETDWHDQAALNGKSRAQAKEWLSSLKLIEGARRLALHIDSVTANATEGAGGMPVLRITTVASATVEPGALSYEDANYPGRAGWKEIVVNNAKDISRGLTYYPTDPSVPQPQDLTAQVKVAPVAAPPVTPVTPAVQPQATPLSAPTVTEPQSFSQQQPTAPGAVVRGDYLSRLLHNRDVGWRLMLFGVLAALGLGAMHALSPGHGKTIVAAYLVGSRGTLKHAGLLGFVVTFTHTFTVFLLGLGVLFFQQYVVPEKIVPVLGLLSGLSIVSVGGMLLYRRSMALLAGEHGHVHFGGATHTHTHQYSNKPDTHTHTQMPDGKLTLASLIALGVSGGIVPCPSALILMLSAIALGHPGLGLVLLIAFSSGLAVVLMGIGMIALYARNLLPNSEATSRRPIFQLIPVFSAVVVICLGLAMSAVSAGWIQPVRFLS